MASSSSAGRPLQRSRSYEYLPPNLSELRVVLLGSKWYQRNLVGNFILGEEAFNYDAQSCVKISGKVENMKITVINTPDLQFPTADSLTDFIKDCSTVSAPGPHVFLLVLQPENFTEEEKNWIYRVLKTFSDRSFDHSFVLILKPRTWSLYNPLPVYINEALIKDVITRCRYRHSQVEYIERPELLTRFDQIVKENNGKHVRYEEFEEARSSFEDFHQNQREEAATGSDVPSAASSFRIVMLGKSEDKKTKLGNFIIGVEEFQQQRFYKTKHRVTCSGEWRGKPVTVIKTPDMFSLSVESFIEEMQSCMSLCYPGPNILLLVVKPSDFTEENRKTLKFILSLFGQDAFRHSMIIFTHDNEISSSVNDLISLVQGRCYNMNTNNRSLLMKKIETIIEENRGTYLTFRDETSRSQHEQMKPLNLVLFGPSGPLKTAAAKVILGHQDLPSESVRKQGEVFGRRVSLVELPALDGKAQQEVMEESFRCVSLCDPEGVHAFILVLPVGPLTDEDKGELHTIQDTFSSRVNDFTIILFTTESDPEHPAVSNFVHRDRDIQHFLQICGGRHFVVNINDRRQIPELMETMERTNVHKNRSDVYTSETFLKVQIEKNIQQGQCITKLEAEIKKFKQAEMDLSAESDHSSKSLRIVLLGKTGCGKSSSGNTILGRKVFKAESNPKSVTKLCQKEECEVDGHHVSVVDTPGLFDDSLIHEEVNDETLKCISLLAPGPHVFLLVIRIGRLTPEEKETVKLIKQGFGKGAEKFTMILFTYGDTLENDDQTIEEYIEKDKDFCEKLISDCGGRYHVFTNSKKQDRSQVRDLIRKINDMVKNNGGSFYTNEMLQEAEAAIQKKTEKILKEKEEEMEREREELRRKYDEEMLEMKRKMEEKDKLKEEAERKLKEMKENIDKEFKERERQQEERERKKREKELEDKTHQQELMEQLKMLDNQIQSEKEEKKSVNKELERIRNEKEKDKEVWEKERREWWEKQKEEEEKRKREEQRKLREFEEQYKKEHERYEEERKKEEQTRRQEEEKQRKILEEKLENLQKEYEEKAREEAVRSNEFQEKYKKKFQDQKKTHEEQIKDKDEKYDLLKALAAYKETEKRKQYQTEIHKLVNCVAKKKENLTTVKDLLIKQEEELKLKKTEAEKEEVQKNHETEISQLLEKLLGEAETKSSCCIL